MKTIHFVIIILVLGFVAQSFASNKALEPVAHKKKLQTDVSFSGSSIDGRYHSAGDAVAEVDQEKYLNSLIGMRKNFHDRLADERANLKGQTP